MKDLKFTSGSGYLTEEIEKDYFYRAGKYITFRKNENEFTNEERPWIVESNIGTIDVMSNEELKKYVKISTTNNK